MKGLAAEFLQHVAPILRRFVAQNGQSAPSDAECAGVAERLWALIERRGLPRPLALGEPGAPGEMSEAESAPLVAHVVEGATNPLLAEAARQLVKACFYPEFKTCRDSYRQKSPDGSCRRQELARARKRVSGTHCVDCPYWIEFGASEHERFLASAWCSDPAEFGAHRDVFLPEDFRALRRWVRARAQAK